jgi:hypothetical protein
MLKISHIGKLNFNRFLLTSPAASGKPANTGTIIEVVNGDSECFPYLWSIIDNGSLKNCEVTFQSHPHLVQSRTVMKVHFMAGRVVGSVVDIGSKKHLSAWLLSSGLWWCNDGQGTTQPPAAERMFTVAELGAMVLRYGAYSTNEPGFFIEAEAPEGYTTAHDGTRFRMVKDEINVGFHMKRVTPRARQPETLHDAKFSTTAHHPTEKLTRVHYFLGDGQTLEFVKVGGDWEPVTTAIEEQTVNIGATGGFLDHCRVKNIRREFNSIRGDVSRPRGVKGGVYKVSVTLFRDGDWYNPTAAMEASGKPVHTDIFNTYVDSMRHPAEASNEDDEDDEREFMDALDDVVNSLDEDEDEDDDDLVDENGNPFDEFPGTLPVKNCPCILNPLDDDVEGKRFIDELGRSLLRKEPPPTMGGVDCHIVPPSLYSAMSKNNGTPGTKSQSIEKIEVGSRWYHVATASPNQTVWEVIDINGPGLESGGDAVLTNKHRVCLLARGGLMCGKKNVVLPSALLAFYAPYKEETDDLTPCPVCSGSGKMPGCESVGNGFDACLLCEGKGRVTPGTETAERVDMLFNAVKRLKEDLEARAGRMGAVPLSPPADAKPAPGNNPPADAPTIINTGDFVAVITNRGERAVGRVAAVEVTFTEPLEGHWNGRLVGGSVCLGVNGGCRPAHIETIPVVTPANKGV